MKTRMILTLIAAIAAVTVAATTRADDGRGAPQAQCRLVTGALRTNFGTFDPASVASEPLAAAMDYRCASDALAGGANRALPVALYWNVSTADGADASARTVGTTVATTYGTGGILGIAQPAQPGAGGFVSVVVAP